MARETGFSREMPALWGPWGSDSEVGVLRDVLMHRPGPELDLVDGSNYDRWLFREPLDAARLRRQFDALVEIYVGHGVRVHLVEGQREDRPNAMFVRDLLFMTHEGAVIARPGHAARRGEERAVARTLGILGVPVARTVAGDGTFDGACAMLVDRGTAVVGTSSRANAQGIDQVEEQLRTMGVEHVVRCDLPMNRIHLDGILNFVDRHKAAVSPWQLPHGAAAALRALGVELIEAQRLDDVLRLGLNMVALGPGCVVMPAGFADSRRLIERHGVEVIEAEVDEIVRAGGAMHCLTGVLRRDPLDLRA